MNALHRVYRIRGARHIFRDARSRWEPVLGDRIQRRSNSKVCHDATPFRVAVIGSGPAGFYAASKLMSRIDHAVVDMYEQLPVPYGLVRFGVAPDHPEVKNCQDKFEEVASSPRFHFIGNINVGRDLPLSSLKPHYDAMLFAYGASKDRSLGIPGEDSLKGIYSARAFVGWYNGLPEYEDLDPKLDLGEEAVVIGQGNVALDVARILLSDVDKLKTTDIADKALTTLSKSRVKRVRVVGRRGPMQASFTIKEIRELMTLPSVGFEGIDPSLLPSDPTKLPRAQKRLVQLLSKGSSTPLSSAMKSWSLDFFLSPLSFNNTRSSDEHLSSLGFAQNVLQEQNPLDPAARVSATDGRVSMPASLAFRSIGYKSESIPGIKDLGVTFDDRKGILPNDPWGRIITLSPNLGNAAAVHIPGMYCAGWVKRGPTGVIASTMDDAFTSAEVIARDWEDKTLFLDGKVPGSGQMKGGWDALKEEVRTKGLREVSWNEWRSIDKAERTRGKQKGKEREKFGSIREMLEAAWS